MHQRHFLSGLQPRACAAGLIFLLLFSMVFPALGETQAASSGLVPPPDPVEHEPVGDDYFEDAVFVGDSMMENIEMLDLFPTANFVTLIGMSPISADKKLFHLPGDERFVTAYDVISQYPHQKIFILLGGNALDHKPSDGTLQDYRRMMERMIQEYPDSYFYVLCPPSMTQSKMAEAGISPKRYQNFREGLRQLAEEKHLYFIDLYALFVGEDGFLLTEHAAFDGFHLKAESSKILEDYIRRHTVEVE